MDGVRNQVGFLPGAYTDQVNAVEGTVGSGKARGYANPQLAQISTWTVASSDTVGDVTVTIRLPDGTLLSATGTDAGSTDTTHADTVVLAINTDDAWSNVATATNIAGVITVVYLHTGLDYTFVSFVTPGAGTIVETSPQTQAAGGAVFPAGRWCIAAANAQDPDIPALALPDGAAAAALIGMSTRPHGQLVNDGLAGDTDPAFAVADMVPVLFDGTIQATNRGTVASLANGAVFVVINVAGGQAFGQSRADADGGNTVTLANNDAYWVSPTAVNARGLIRIRR